jgi:hypothetical protein
MQARNTVVDFTLASSIGGSKTDDLQSDRFTLTRFVLDPFVLLL